MNKNKKRVSWVAIMLVILVCVFDGWADDSIPAPDLDKVVNLDEIVVKADRLWMEGDKIVTIPTKSEKKMSYDAATLIDAMNLPFIKASGENILTLTNEKVEIYINGQKADSNDLQTFWPMDVKRVEYIQNPSDAQFKGAKQVVNFIIKVYEFGGVVKVFGNQQFPNNGRYNAAANLSYKKMSYGASVTYNYLNDHIASSEGRKIYNDVWYDDKFYEEIEQIYNESSINRNQGVTAAFKARYSTKDFNCNHNVSFLWNENPGSSWRSQDKWNHNLFNGNTSQFHSTGASMSPNLIGDYFWTFNPKWSFSLLWKYSYARNDNDYWTQFGDTDRITNSSVEDVNTLYAGILTTFQPTKQWTFQAKVNMLNEWFATQYGGSSTSRTTQNRQKINAAFAAFWKPNSKWLVSLMPGLTANLWQVGTYSEKTCSPILRGVFGLRLIAKLLSNSPRACICFHLLPRKRPTFSSKAVT